jgi:hypothetical protein
MHYLERTLPIIYKKSKINLSNNLNIITLIFYEKMKIKLNSDN